MKTFHIFLALVTSMFIAVACTKQQQQQVIDGIPVAVKVSDAVCQALGESTQPEWVVLACEAQGIAGGIVKIAVPKREWASIRARSLDVGPGK